MHYEITTGAKYFYSSLSKEMQCEIELSAPINGEMLDKALGECLVRYPFMNTYLTISDDRDRLVLKERDDRYHICKFDDNVIEKEGSILAVKYKGNNVLISVSHGLMDGMGFIKFIRLLIGRYLDITDIIIGIDDIRNILSESPKIEEYADPFSFVKNIENPIIHKKTALNYHCNKEVLHNEVYCESAQVNFIDKNYFFSSCEGSMSGFVSLIMAKALKDEYPNNVDLEITSPVNIRRTLGCEETFQNCHLSTSYVISEKLLQHKYEEQLSMLKGMLYLQSLDEVIHHKYGVRKNKIMGILSTKTLKEKYEAFDLTNISSDSLCCSYIGKLGVDDFSPFIKTIHFANVGLEIPNALIVCSVQNDKLCFEYSSNFKSQAFSRFIDILKDYGLEVFNITKQKSFHPLFRVVKI